MDGSPDTHKPDAPLVVDLDGTLIHCDLLHESILALVHTKPFSVPLLPLWLLRGKALFKQQLAERVSIDVTCLPYNEDLLAWLRSERQAGRRIVLATASNEKFARAVADHLDIFDDVIASTDTINCASGIKAAALIDRFGSMGFDYAGNSQGDVAVWRHSRESILVSAPSSVCRAAEAVAPVSRVFERQSGGIRVWAKAARLHQWAKNILLFLPLLGSHRIFEAHLLARAGVAFLAFGLCASAVYVLNDLVDLESDRHHPRKRHRPFASGQIPPFAGLAAICALLAASATLAIFVSWPFAAWLTAYFVSTICYTFWLKKKEIVDTIALAGLYTLRILAGGAAVGIAASSWLLAFSLFLFLSLALVKRYAEIRSIADHGKSVVAGRGYVVDDLPLIEMLGVAAGFAAVIVLALYIDGSSVSTLYRHPQILWLAVPILLFWISRIWMKTHRGSMNEDPVLFAMKDRTSILSGIAFLAVMWTAA